jgi:hypothetical protein
MTGRRHDPSYEAQFRLPANDDGEPKPDLVIEEWEIEDDDDGDTDDDRLRPFRKMLFWAVAFAILIGGYVLF